MTKKQTTKMHEQCVTFIIYNTTEIVLMKCEMTLTSITHFFKKTNQSLESPKQHTAKHLLTWLLKKLRQKY